MTEARVFARSGGALKSVADAIGGTPLIELARLTRGMPGSIIAKLEFLNPGFSKKDRIAREMVDEARASGQLKPGQLVVELTSGNTGTGLAIVCAVRGHPFVAVMSQGNSRERARMMHALGAEVVLVPQAPGGKAGAVTGADLALVEERARQITEERNGFRANQFENAANRLAHEKHTGPELWEQAGGRISAFCDFIGTGGTYAGVTAALKRQDPSIRCFVVEPEGADVLAGGQLVNANHPIQGGGYGVGDLTLLAGAAVDGFLAVSEAEAVATTRRLAREEGLLAGYSSGAVVAASLKLLEAGEVEGHIAVVLADSGLKYLSTDLWPDLPVAKAGASAAVPKLEGV